MTMNTYITNTTETVLNIIKEELNTTLSTMHMLVIDMYNETDNLAVEDIIDNYEFDSEVYEIIYNELVDDYNENIDDIIDILIDRIVKNIKNDLKDMIEKLIEDME